MKKTLLYLLVFAQFTIIYGQSIIRKPAKAFYKAGDTVTLSYHSGKYLIQDLSSIANKSSNYSGLASFPFGGSVFNGTPFYISNSSANTAWNSYTTGTNTAPVSATYIFPCPTIVDTVYFFMNTGYGKASLKVHIQLNYINGSSQILTFNGGNQIRDWNQHNQTNSCTSSNTFQVWAEDASSTINAGGKFNMKRLDMQKVVTQTASKLQSIKFIDSGSDIQGEQRVFLNALTVHTTIEPKITWRIGSPLTGTIVDTGGSIKVSPPVGTRYYFAENQDSCYISDSIVIVSGASSLELVNDINMGSLGQCQPTIASNNIVIPYRLDRYGQENFINLISIQGVMIKSIQLESKVGYNEVNLDLSQLADGIYFYSLNIDGKVVDTKKVLVLK